MRSTGFTLIELMVALAVLAVVSAIAIPIYTQYSIRTYRTEAMADLMSCAQGMERHASINFSYINPIDTDADGIGDANIGAVSANICTPNTQFYNITVTAATANTFIVRGAAMNAGNPVGTDGMMEMDETGARRWDRTNDGDFGDTDETSWK